MENTMSKNNDSFEIEPFYVLGVIVGTRHVQVDGEGEDYELIAFGYVPNEKAAELFPKKFYDLCKLASEKIKYGKDDFPPYSVKVDYETGSIDFIHDYGVGDDEDEPNFGRMSIHG